jgi:ABC-type Fe3+-hydroxamate transport system substrate-binding protein
VGGTKDPDVAAIIALEPDLVVMDEEENRKEDADALTASGLRVFVTAVRSIDDVAPTLRRLAEAIGVDPGDVDADHRPVAVRWSAFVPIWRRPWMTISGDTYGSSLLAACGVANAYTDAPDRYPTVTLDDVKQRRVDRVLAPSEPFPFAERHRAELETVAPATFIDGRDLFWWGVRTPAAIARLQADLARD